MCATQHSHVLIGGKHADEWRHGVIISCMGAHKHGQIVWNIASIGIEQQRGT